MDKISKKDWVASLFALVFLVGAGADRISVLPPPGSSSYHQRVRQAATAITADFGDWTAQDCPIPAEASKLLRPNAVISRSYINPELGERVAFLLIQCSDVRDMISHYPPICYPYRGLTLVKKSPRMWEVDGLQVPATEYQFESTTFQTPNLTIVENFMILPEGQIAPDMEQVKQKLRIRSRYFGAAQVQIVFQSGETELQRQNVSRQLISHYKPLLDIIRSGVQR